MRYLLIAALLVGCSTPAQRAEKDIAKYAPYCEKLGYQKDSDQWRDCIQKQSAADDAPRQVRVY